MNCPNCGAPEKSRVKICPECEHAYSSQDLLELRQLEFLLEETNTWQIADTLRSPYQKRLDLLIERLHLQPKDSGAIPPEPEIAPGTLAEQITPFVVIRSRTKVFSGPGTNYSQLGFASSGKKAPLIGISRNKKWWVIKVPTSAEPLGQGWISAYDVTAFHAEEVPVIQAPLIPAEEAPEPAKEKVEPAPPAPPKEKVPFDQWLLSERNIKITLYSGGLLLLIAGIIFIGVNWTRIPGPGKFAITLMVTGLMYLGGYLLVQRPAYRIGGVALLGIASGFFVLNFAVLQIYVMGPRGMSDIVMWLIASPFCLLLYMLTAYWTKSDLFTYFSLFAFGSTLTAALVLSTVPELIYLLAFSLFALLLLILAQGFSSTQLAGFTHQPCKTAAHILAPLTFLWALVILIVGEGLLPLDTGKLWLSLVILVLGSTFYSLNAYWYKHQIPTYLSLVSISITLTAALYFARVPVSAYLLSYASLSLLMLVLAQLAKKSKGFNFTRYPLLILSNLLMPATYLAAFFYLVVPAAAGTPWFTLLIFGMGAIFYLLMAYLDLHLLFSYACLGAIAGLVFAVLFLLEVPLLVYPLVYAAFAVACLTLAWISQETPFSDMTRFPLLSTSQVLMPATIFLSTAGWITHELIVENPWLAVSTLALGVLYYILTDVLFKRLEARWAFAVLIPVTLGLTFYELNFSLSTIGISCMVLAISYLGIGYALENRENRKAGGWPFYATAYVISGLVTILAVPNTEDLTKILFADVVILAVSAAIHRVYWWVYGAVWLFILPVYLTISLYITEFHYQGLLMGLLGLNYVAAGYILGRRELQLGAPFLLAAAFLTVVATALTWKDPITATLVMSVSAALYLLVGLWLGWTWLVYPGLVFVNLILLTMNVIFFSYQPPIEHALLISYTSLGVILILAGFVLHRINQDRWSWPLYIIGIIDISAAYVISFVFADWLTAAISAVVSILLFSFAWLERDLITRLVRIPILTYLGIGVLFIGHFLLLFLIAGEGSWDLIWSIYTAGLCAIFFALGWLLKRDPLEKIYSTPLRWSGLCLMVIPMLGSLLMFLISLAGEPNPFIVPVTFAISGAVYGGDALMRRSARESYLSLLSLLVVIWGVLYALDVYEPQAFIIPVGLTILGIGWYEKKRGGQLIYKLLTYTGLILLMGTAFIQSIPRGAYLYAVLVAAEAIASILWGWRSRCRCFVQVGGLVLIANAVVQLGPGLIELPRWIQIGLTGAILLGGGMAALFKREQILNTRQRLTDEWRQWNP